MTALTDALETSLLNAILRGTNYTSSPTLWLALFTTPTTDLGGGNEVSGSGYARQQISFGAPVNGICLNTNMLSYTNMPGVTITHTAIMTAQTGGTMLLHGALQNQRALTAADTVTFVPGALAVTLD